MSEQHSQQNLVQANIDADDMGHNTSNNPSFDQILAVRLSRRGLLKGGFSLMAASVLGTGLVACGGGVVLAVVARTITTIVVTPTQPV